MHSVSEPELYVLVPRATSFSITLFPSASPYEISHHFELLLFAQAFPLTMAVFFSLLFLLFVASSEGSPISSDAALSPHSNGTVEVDICHSCRSIGVKCPRSCDLDPICVPRWEACDGPKNRYHTSKCCAKGWRCVRPKNASGSAPKRCEPPAPIPSDTDVTPTICHSCRSRGFKCPRSCGFDPICVPRWEVCSGTNNRYRTSKCCTKGWRCVRPMNEPNFGEKRCEPPSSTRTAPPVTAAKHSEDSICHSCRSRGFKCPASCEFDPICVPRGEACSGPNNRYHTSQCCTKGWRCIRPKNAGNSAPERCEPPRERCVPKYVCTFVFSNVSFCRQTNSCGNPED